MARIVFCDDDPSVRKLVQATMRSTDHDIHIAHDGAEGLELIERLLPDAVFTDVSMPNMTGIELVEEMRTRPHLAHIPVVAITASLQRGHISELSSHGIQQLIRKPFKAGDLRAKVDDVVKSGRVEVPVDEAVTHELEESAP